MDSCQESFCPYSITSSHANTEAHLPKSKGQNSSPKCSKRRTESKTVRFSTVEIREYGIVLGDHPGRSLSPTNGPSISLSWSYNRLQPFSIIAYEQAKSTDQVHTINNKALSSFEREDMLKEYGFSRSEMEESVKSKNLIKDQRRRSRKPMTGDRLRLAIKNVMKKSFKLLGPTVSMDKYSRRESQLSLALPTKSSLGNRAA